MENEKILKRATLCFLVKKRYSQVCLGLKTSHIGAGKRNGAGGGIEPNEKPKESASREMLEELKTKVWVQDLKIRAILYCHNKTESGEEFLCKVLVFVAEHWAGLPRDTEELTDIRWFPIDALPLEELLLGDREWLPRMLQNEKQFFVEMWYGPHQETLLQPTVIKELDVLPKE